VGDDEVEYRSVRQHFGIRASGAAAWSVCDGEEITMTPGQLLFVEPRVLREGVPLETPTTMLVVGGLPGMAYAPPPFALDSLDEPSQPGDA